jgi:hypothetical protein
MATSFVVANPPRAQLRYLPTDRTYMAPGKSVIFLGDPCLAP